jgi:hypothetical protein
MSLSGEMPVPREAFFTINRIESQFAVNGVGGSGVDLLLFGLGDLSDVPTVINPGSWGHKFLSENKLSVRHPYSISMEGEGGLDLIGTDESVVTAAEAAPVLNEGVETADLQELSYSLGAETLASLTDYTVEVWVKTGASGLNPAGAPAGHWARISRMIHRTAFTETIQLNRMYSRTFVRIAAITTAGGPTLSRKFGHDGDDAAAARIWVVAWYDDSEERCEDRR